MQEIGDVIYLLETLSMILYWMSLEKSWGEDIRVHAKLITPHDFLSEGNYLLNMS